MKSTCAAWSRAPVANLHRRVLLQPRALQPGSVGRAHVPHRPALAFPAEDQVELGDGALLDLEIAARATAQGDLRARRAPPARARWPAPSPRPAPRRWEARAGCVRRRDGWVHRRWARGAARGGDWRGRRPPRRAGPDSGSSVERRKLFIGSAPRAAGEPRSAAGSAGLSGPSSSARSYDSRARTLPGRLDSRNGPHRVDVGLGVGPGWRARKRARYSSSAVTVRPAEMQRATPRKFPASASVSTSAGGVGDALQRPSVRLSEAARPPRQLARVMRRCRTPPARPAAHASGRGSRRTRRPWGAPPGRRDRGGAAPVARHLLRLEVGLRAGRRLDRWQPPHCRDTASRNCSGGSRNCRATPGGSPTPGLSSGTWRTTSALVMRARRVPPASQLHPVKSAGQRLRAPWRAYTPARERCRQVDRRGAPSRSSVPQAGRHAGAGLEGRRAQ